MKKYTKIGIIILGLLMVFCFYGCGNSSQEDVKKGILDENISDEEKIAQDLNEHLKDDGFSDFSVQINLEKHDDDNAVFEVTANMTAPVKYRVNDEYYDGKMFIGEDTADVVRKYRLEYTHYDKGGWQMEKCEEQDKEGRKASPRVFDIPEEYLCRQIFMSWGDEPSNDLCHVDNVRYRAWTTGGRGHSYLPIDYIQSVEIVEKNENIVKILAHCSAESDVIRISEDILTVWEFDQPNLIWDCTSAVSCGGEHEIKDNGLTGTYVYEDYWSNDKKPTISLEKDGNNILVTATDFLMTVTKSVIKCNKEVASIKGIYSFSFDFDSDGVVSVDIMPQQKSLRRHYSYNSKIYTKSN